MTWKSKLDRSMGRLREIVLCQQDVVLAEVSITLSKLNSFKGGYHEEHSRRISERGLNSQAGDSNLFSGRKTFAWAVLN